MKKCLSCIMASCIVGRGNVVKKEGRNLTESKQSGWTHALLSAFLPRGDMRWQHRRHKRRRRSEERNEEQREIPQMPCTKGPVGSTGQLGCLSVALSHDLIYRSIAPGSQNLSLGLSQGRGLIWQTEGRRDGGMEDKPRGCIVRLAFP